MKSDWRGILAILLMAALLGCNKHSDSRPGQDGEESAGGASSDESGGRSPIAMTEKRFQAYVAYRKELHGLLKEHMQDLGTLSKKVDGKSNDVTKTLTAIQGIKGISDKQESAQKALRKKHGFEEEEDNRLWDAIGEVVTAKPLENPAIEPSLKMYREMQAKGGEEKKVADEALKSLEEGGKESLERARDLCGGPCVEILCKHVKELGELQMDAVQQISGGAAAAK